MKNTKLIVKTKSKSYPIYFGNNILNTTNRLIKKNLPDVKKIFIVSDTRLPRSALKKLVNSLKGYDLKVYKLPSSEKTKSLKVANKIIELLLKNNFNRSDCVIAFGGGVVGVTGPKRQGDGFVSAGSAPGGDKWSRVTQQHPFGREIAGVKSCTFDDS